MRNVNNQIVRRNSQMGQRDSGSIGRVSEALNGSKTGGQTSGMNIATFDEFDPYSNSYKKYD